MSETTETLDFVDTFLNYSNTDMETLKIFTKPASNVDDEMARIAERSGCENWNEYETAICEYCGTKISTGKYSWVLAGIEQVC